MSWERDGTDVFQERWDQEKENINMGKVNSFPTKKAEDLEHMDRIIDPEGNEATVIRIRRMDHQRGRLETDLGVAVVPLSQRFPLLP